jgi:CubicO group peptidase (beta-lactamase class C family)
MTYVPLPRALPHERGVDAGAIVDFLSAITRADLEVHSFMLYRQGAVVAEAFWQPYSARRMHVQHSATKSWTATAVGLLVDDGRLKLEDKVVSFFPELCPVEVSANLAAMTVEDLLTMRTGHQRGISGGAWRNLQTSWVEAFLQEPVDEPPGKSFIYSSASSFMLSAIVTRVTGQTLHALLQERVLYRLGLDKLEWDLAPGGINSGGNGLSCTTEDSLKFGVLHLNKGLWQGCQLLSPEWIAKATRNQVDDVWMGEFDGKQYLPRNKDAANEAKREGYGYQWWMTPQGGYYASGVFGQYCIVLPEQDTVIAFTCGLRLGERRLHAAIWEQLFPGLGREAMDPQASQAQLDALIDDPSSPTKTGFANWPSIFMMITAISVWSTTVAPTACASVCSNRSSPSPASPAIICTTNINRNRPRSSLTLAGLKKANCAWTGGLSKPPLAITSAAAWKGAACCSIAASTPMPGRCSARH